MKENFSNAEGLITGLDVSRIKNKVQLSTGCPKIIVPHLGGCYEGALNLIILVLHSQIGQASNLEFETLFESI